MKFNIKFLMKEYMILQSQDQMAQHLLEGERNKNAIKENDINEHTISQFPENTEFMLFFENKTIH